MLRGSVLEVLVAIPTHIVTRRKHDCCAPTYSLMGIAAGLAVACLSYGPGLYFLFAKRAAAKRGKLAVSR